MLNEFRPNDADQAPDSEVACTVLQEVATVRCKYTVGFEVKQ